LGFNLGTTHTEATREEDPNPTPATCTVPDRPETHWGGDRETSVGGWYASEDGRNTPVWPRTDTRTMEMRPTPGGRVHTWANEEGQRCRGVVQQQTRSGNAWGGDSRYWVERCRGMVRGMGQQQTRSVYE
jgi:hypothetical protein